MPAAFVACCRWSVSSAAIKDGRILHPVAPFQVGVVLGPK